MTAEARSQPVVARFGPGSEFAGYRIERLLDRGGMGIVYVATEIDLGRTVALKIIAPEHSCDETAVARFRSEARLAASLEHPNIVPVHRGGECDGVLFLAMRFVSETTLRHVVDRGPMDLRRAGRIITQIGAALDAAHARGLIHRDVKPANVLLRGDGDSEHVFLTDFGLTKRLGSAGDLTRTGACIGTLDYVAPEQIQGHHVDRRADIYSLGCMLFEMLIGAVAYPKDSDMAKLWAHVTDPPPLPRDQRRDLVEEFDVVVAKATAKDPDDRYATAGEMTAAVRDAIAAQETMRRNKADQPTGEVDVAPLAATVAEPPSASAPAASAPLEAPPASAPPVPAPAEPVRGPGASVADAVAVADGSRGRRDRRPPLNAVLLGAAVTTAAVGVILLGAGSTKTPRSADPAGDKVSADLGAVAMNRVRGAGDVTVRLNGDVASVTVDTTGLLNAGPHPLHIHANGRGVCPPASAAKPHNGHPAIFARDGKPYYGRPVTALTTTGDTSASSILALDRYPHIGKVRYRRTFRLSKAVAADIRRHNAVIVVHGIDYNHNSVYDDSLGRSDLQRSLPGELTAPALCGPLVPATTPEGSTDTSATSQGPRSRGGVYHAWLRREPGAAGRAWLCRLHRVSAEAGIPT
jgi:serine/threonine-protein kinase